MKKKYIAISLLKTTKINRKYEKDHEKMGQQKEKRTEIYIKGSLIQTNQ